MCISKTLRRLPFVISLDSNHQMIILLAMAILLRPINRGPFERIEIS